MAVPYTFGNTPGGQSIPLTELDQNFAYIESQIGSGAGATGPTGPTGAASTVVGPTGPTGASGPAGFGITYKGSVATVGALPATGNTVGDAYIVASNYHLYIWNGSSWIDNCLLYTSDAADE